MKKYFLYLSFLVFLATAPMRNCLALPSEAAYENWKENQYTYNSETFTIKFPEVPREVVKNNELHLTFNDKEVSYTLYCSMNKNNNSGFEFLKDQVPAILQSKPPYLLNISNNGKEQNLEWVTNKGSNKIFVTPQTIYYFICTGTLEDVHTFFDSFKVINKMVKDVHES